MIDAFANAFARLKLASQKPALKTISFISVGDEYSCLRQRYSSGALARATRLGVTISQRGINIFHCRTYNYARTRKASPSRGKGLAESRQRSRRVAAKVSEGHGKGLAESLQRPRRVAAKVSPSRGKGLAESLPRQGSLPLSAVGCPLSAEAGRVPRRDKPYPL